MRSAGCGACGFCILGWPQCWCPPVSGVPGLCCPVGQCRGDATGCMGWQGPGYPAPVHGSCACPHATAQTLQPASPGQIWGSVLSLSTWPHSTTAHSADACFSLLPLGIPLFLHQSHNVCLPSPWKSPGVPLCRLPLSMRRFTQQEQPDLFFPGVLRPPAWASRGRGCPAHPSWELQVQVAAQGNSAATALLPACTRGRQGSASTMAGSRQHPAGRDLATGAAGLGHMLPFTSTGRARVSKSLAASTLGCINNQPADGEGFTSCFS